MNLPSLFIEKTKLLLGDEWLAFEQSLTNDQVTSVRLNPAKANSILQPEDRVRWSCLGYYLSVRPSFTFDPLFHAGCYYVQEASSMFVEQVVKQYIDGDLCALDLCAAPGGKSTHLVSLLSENSLVVANEVIRSRANILVENTTKWGYPNVVVTNNDPREIGRVKDLFDLILIDAPCSGEGMFRKGASQEWSTANVQLCKERQQRIVSDVWDSLKPGGILIYSTCTYNTEENEENVIWIKSVLGAELLELNVPDEWNVTSSLKGELPVYHFLPHKVKGEGFFLAALRKNGELEPDVKRPKKKDKISKSKPAVLPIQYQSYLKYSDKFAFFDRSNVWYALDKDIFNNWFPYMSSLKILHAGVCIGETKGTKFVPHESLALSVAINRDAFVCYDLDWHTSIKYLRNESLVLPSDLPLGYILLTYKNHPLGFVKNIGNRANNLYPQEWRIRSGFLPDNRSEIVF